MKVLSNIATLLALLMMVAFAGCSNESSSDGGGNSGQETEMLDLRIKNGGKVYSARAVREQGVVAGDTATTTHVTARTVSNGIQFDIQRPEDECYADGFGNVLIYRVENGEQTTGVLVNSRGSHSVLTAISFLYPLCEKGEEYELKVQIEPQDLNNNRNHEYYEYVKLTALGGIGDIDYSKINKKNWVTAQELDGKPVVEIKDCIPPEAKNERTFIDFFAGNGDWETNNATVWFTSYTSASGIEFTVNPSDEWVSSVFTPALQETGKTQWFANYKFKFDIPGYENAIWMTKEIRSNFVSID